MAVYPAASNQGGVVLPTVLGRYRDGLEGALRSSLDPLGLEGLRVVLAYHMGWADAEGRPVAGPRGKALRPALCLFVCEAVGGDPARAVPAACALELVHNFSLIHDDIQDNDRERRHRPTVWALWGKPRALASGNALRTVADLALWGLVRVGAPPDLALTCARVLTRGYLEMIEGQFLDLSYEGRLDITVEDYLDMVSRKTGALIEAATHLGALLGGAGPDRVEAMRRCGRALGLAFQARDDILGIWGEESATGKATGADIRRRKKSLPVVFALQRAGPRLADLYRRREMDGEAVARVMGLLEEVGAREFAQRFAQEQGERALQEARRANLPHWAFQALEELTGFILHRQH